jgi:hypothetical protein
LYPRHARPDATYGEKRVLELLSGLDDQWYVLHSLSYVTVDRRPRPGEADFVLLHRRFGMLVIEVKDGQYCVEQRQWTLIRSDGTEIVLDRNPFEQAIQNRFDLRNLLKDATGIRHVPVGHCVLFTHGRPSSGLGVEGPAEIVLTLASLSPPRAAIRSVVDYWGHRPWDSDEDFEKALAALCPTSVIAPTLSYTIDASADELEELTERQIEWTTDQVEALTRISAGGNVLLLGAAGTGKTIIAQHRARSLAGEGGTVALFGQHRHLRLQLRRKVRLKGVHCGDELDILAGLYGLDELAHFAGGDLWVTVMTLVEEYGPRLDHLVVDEAQSYDEHLLEAVQTLVRPGGTVLLLADPYQRDSSGTWLPAGTFEKQLLNTNCRNVYPIARLVSKLSGAQPPRSGPDGAIPVFTQSEDVEGAAIAIVAGLLTELAADRIVVLAETVAHQHAIRSAARSARLPCELAIGPGDPGLLVSTVDVFRGCEAEAVVYVTGRQPAPDRTLDYIAVSRACSYLHVVGTGERWENVVYLMGGRS